MSRTQKIRSFTPNAPVALLAVGSELQASPGGDSGTSCGPFTFTARAAEPDHEYAIQAFCRRLVAHQLGRKPGG